MDILPDYDVTCRSSFVSKNKVAGSKIMISMSRYILPEACCDSWDQINWDDFGSFLCLVVFILRWFNSLVALALSVGIRACASLMSPVNAMVWNVTHVQPFKVHLSFPHILGGRKETDHKQKTRTGGDFDSWCVFIVSALNWFFLLHTPLWICLTQSLSVILVQNNVLQKCLFILSLSHACYSFGFYFPPCLQPTRPYNNASVSFFFTFFLPVDTIVQMTTIFSTLIRQVMPPADTPSVPLSQPLLLTCITSYTPPSKWRKYETVAKREFTQLGARCKPLYVVNICL